MPLSPLKAGEGRWFTEVATTMDNVNNTNNAEEEARRAKRRQSKAAYKAAHPDVIKEQKKRWKARVMEKAAADPVAREKRLQAFKDYSATHKEARAASNKAYYERKKAERVAAAAAEQRRGGEGA